jgi:hypothetical protein
MAGYRAYIIGIDGRFVGAIALVCSDDEIAKESAKRLVGDHDVELWRNDRKIDTFSPTRE